MPSRQRCYDPGPIFHFPAIFHHLFRALSHSFFTHSLTPARTATQSPDKSPDGSPDHSAVDYHMPLLRSPQPPATSPFISLRIDSS